MRGWFLAAAAGALLRPTFAFPTPENIAHYADAGALDLRDLDLGSALQQLRDRKAKRLLFDPLTSPIDVSGDHEWRAPDFSSGAQRGPCPGLNALANHGYISRDGVASFVDIIGTMNDVYGMSIELATVLSVMGTVWTGDPLSLSPGFSLDKNSDKVVNLLGNLLGLIGEPRGIGRSHNWLEADASLTRDDLYVTGDASTMNYNKFLALYNRPGDNTDIISTDDILQHSIEGIETSKQTNPYFWYGPLTGMIFRNAGIAFAVRLLSNHSAENPGGVMTKDTFRSIWGVVENADSTMEYKRGWERIPENWYRIPVDYGLVSLNVDLVDWMTRYPVLASIGGNTGTVNSFTPLDISNVTSGLVNTKTLLEGNNLICFVLQVVKTFSPDSLSPLFATLGDVLGLLTNTLGTAITDLSCAPFEDLEYGGQPLWDSLLKLYPGPAKAGSAL